MEININILQPTPLSPGAVYLRWSDPEMTVNKRKNPQLMLQQLQWSIQEKIFNQSVIYQNQIKQP